MPLDPEATALLEALRQAGAPPVEQQTVEQARESFQALRELAGPPEPVASVEDRRISGPAGQIAVRVYRPPDRGALPVLVYLHGGGWVIGNLETVDVPVRALVNRAGCVAVSVDYRLAPEHKFPTPLEDCYAATRWVAENANALGVDLDRIAIGGDSAGGNLAAAVALAMRDRGGPRLAFQLLIYPVTDFNLDSGSYRANGDGYLLTRSGMEWFWSHYLHSPADGERPYASPLRAADLHGLPPALVITAEFDPLRDEGEAYAGRLAGSGVPVTLKRYDGMIHGFFQLGGMLSQGRRAVDDVAAALRAALRA